MLTPEKCATLANAPPSEPILERERCSICKVITDNARLWNWVQHYSSLCYGVPPHAQEWVSSVASVATAYGRGLCVYPWACVGTMAWGGAGRGRVGGVVAWRVGCTDIRGRWVVELQ